MKPKAIISFFIAVSLYCLPLMLAAQTTPAVPGEDPDRVDIPVDGGLSLLLAAGISYVAKKGYDKRKKTLSDL